MKVDLDKFELMYFIEGCARGSHLRQHVWRRVVNEFLRQLDNDEIDWFWWVMYRDLWTCYFSNPQFGPHVGAEGYIHALAAYNRNNRFKVCIDKDEQNVETICYRFQNRFKPLCEDCFDMYVPEEDIKSVEQIFVPEVDSNMEYRFVPVWKDISIYDKELDDLLNLNRKGL